MKDSKSDKKDCLNSITFTTFCTVIFTCESVSFILSLILFVITSWKYLKKGIKFLNIICLSFIAFLIILNIILYCTLKTIKQQIIQKFISTRIFIVFLILFYFFIVIFNVFDAIYLSINLHIADYPEYGGRNRDQNYINEHPDEFGNVPLSEFIIVAVCPSVISVLNVMCVVINILIRNKMMLIYNKEKERIAKTYGKGKNKNKNHKHKNSINNIKSSVDDLNNNTAQTYNNKMNGKSDVIRIKINNSDDDEDGYEIKVPKKVFGTGKVETTESIKQHLKEYNDEIPTKFFFGGREVRVNEETKNKEYNLEAPKKITINSMKETKSTIDYKNNN